MRRLLFTWTFVLIAAATQVARADRVVLLPPSGTAEVETLDEIEERLAGAIVAVGHEAVTDSAAVGPDAPPPPETANEMKAVAEMQNAGWVVVPRVTPLPGQYRLHLRVGQAAGPRVEEIEVIVLHSNEEERLRDVLGAMLRPEGLGEDAVRLTEPQDGATTTTPPDGEDADSARRREEEERARLEAEERARQEFEEREAQRRAEEERRAEEAWEARERYGDRGPWMFNVGLDLRPVIAHQEVIVEGEDRGGGVLGGVSIRGGRSFEGLRGFELRVAADFTTGASSGFGLAAGAVYLFAPFEDTPVFIGAGVEAGWFQFTTGNSVASFMGRVAPVVVWRATEGLYFEAALPELMLLTANGGVGTLGLSIRGGTRF